MQKIRQGDWCSSRPLFVFLKKTLYEVIASGLQLSFNIFRWPSTWHAINMNCIQNKTN